MLTLPPEPFSRFDLNLTHARAYIESEADYWAGSGTEAARQRRAELAATGDLVRLDTSIDAVALFTPTEALTVAAALQAVAVYLLEQCGRESVVR